MHRETDTAEHHGASAPTADAAQCRPGVVNGALRDRLAEIAAANELVPCLPATEIRGHVLGMRSFLHDHVLRQAHAEELVLIPALQRAAVQPAAGGSGLVAEHDTLREATAALDDMAWRAVDTATVGVLAGVLEGVTLLLDHHLDHETDVSAALLDQLAPAERDDLASRLASLDAPLTTTPRPWWLPEKLPREQTLGCADRFEPEGMVGASCDPAVLAVARSAAAAALEGVDAAGWRQALLEHSRYRAAIDTAHWCMRTAGLWPWHPAHPTACILRPSV